jgi:glycine cleavage system H protein
MERGENVAPAEGLLFSKEHEWVKLDGESATIGITDYAQNALGDIVYVELPKVGEGIKQFSNIGVIESVKAVSDLFTPMSGEIVEVNEALQDDPAAVNREPYDAGWLLRLRVSDPNEAQNLLSAADYEKIAVD